jgi:hypothetical protein
LKGFDPGGLGLATVADLASESDEVEEPEAKEEKRDLDLWD